MTHLGHRPARYLKCICFVLLCPAFGTLSGIAQGAVPPSIGVDPNVRISYEGNDAVHQEAPIAASATARDQLYAASTMYFPDRDLLESETRLYRSVDAGATWTPIALQELSRGSWDSSIAAGIDGTAYFVTSATKPRALHVFRTRDHGNTWKSISLEKTGMDRPFSVVDTTASPYSGRLYIIGSAMGTGSGGLVLYTSSDGGVTFQRSPVVCTGDQAGVQPLVSHDGSLIVPCRFHGRRNGSLRVGHRASCRGTTHEHEIDEIGVVVSKDGGQTFSRFRSIATVARDCGSAASERLKEHRLIGTVPYFVLAAASGPGAISSRLYAAWISLETSGKTSYRTLWVSSSSDYGSTWSRPQTVGGSSMKNRLRTDQAYPMLGVNKDGIVGLAWYDNRNTYGGAGYDIYFAASTDEGRTFSPEVRVSEISSDPTRAENASPKYSVLQSRKDFAVFSNRYVVRNLGADYAQMTVDAAGRFHPLWLDTRHGAWQLYTSTIRVNADAEATMSTNDPLCDLNDRIEFVFGESSWKHGVLQIDFRLKNASDRVIAEEILVEFRNDSADPSDPVSAIRNDERAAAIWPRPSIVDPTSGEAGRSAVYKVSAHKDAPLFPNGVSRWNTLRLNIPHAYEMLFSLGRRVWAANGKCPATLAESE